jgi:hypothetical protein
MTKSFVTILTSEQPKMVRLAVHSKAMSRRRFTTSLAALAGTAGTLGLAACGGGGGGGDAPTNSGSTPAGTASGVLVQLIAGQPNSATSTFEQINGTGAAAKLGVIQGLDVQSDGTIWVCDNYNHTIHRITPAGVVTTPYGKAKVMGLTDGAGEAALFTDLSDLSIDESSGQAIVTVDQGAEGVLRSMNVTTLGTTSSLGKKPGVLAIDFADGPIASRSVIPTCIAAGKPELGKSVTWVGELGILDVNKLRKITNGQITTVATPEFYPKEIVVNAAGEVFALMGGLLQSKIVKFTTAGAASLVAGNVSAQPVAQEDLDKDGTGAAASFSAAAGLSIDKSSGNMYLSTNGGLRQITPDGVVTTLVPFLDLLEAYPEGTAALISYMVCIAPKRFIVASQSQVHSLTLP